jgi:ribosomal protein S18 acetylase RimI-like enzyme
MEDFVIRTATADDIDELVRLAGTTFYDAFVKYPENSLDDLNMVIDEYFNKTRMTSEFNDPDVTYYIAEIDGVSVGYAKVRRHCHKESVTGNDPIEICSLYLVEEFIGKGIGKAVMKHCLEFAEQHGHDTVWLGVYSRNFHAIDFYRNFGFERCGEHIFQFGDDPQIDWLMQRKVII